MAWSTPASASANAVYTSAFYNTNTRDNLNALGAMYGLKQTVVSSAINDSRVTASFVDFTNASISITTTGGFLQIYTVPAADGADIRMHNNNSGQDTPQIVCLVGATSLPYIVFPGGVTTANAPSYWPANGLRWRYAPTAGTYTVKLQGKVATATGSADIGIIQCFLVVEEWGLVSA